jgi:hypothetical protein
VDSKTNAVLKKMVCEATLVQKEKAIYNGGLEDAALVADLFGEVNDGEIARTSTINEAIALAERARLCRKIAAAIRERKKP